jgi:hypothetical protein
VVRSAEAEGLPGYCSSSPFDHLLYPRREQAFRRWLRFLSFLSRLGRSRLDPSLGASCPASGSLRVIQLRCGRFQSNTRLFQRCRQVHDRNGLSSCGGRGGNMKGCTPWATADPGSSSSSSDQSLKEEGPGNLLEWLRGSPDSSSSSLPSSPWVALEPSATALEPASSSSSPSSQMTSSSECSLSAVKPVWRAAKFSTVCRANKFCPSRAGDGQAIDNSRKEKQNLSLIGAPPRSGCYGHKALGPMPMLLGV